MLDPVTAQILTGLVVEGLSSFIGRSVAELELTPSSIEQVIADTLSQFGEVECIADDLGGEALRSFLKSPEAHALVRRIFAARKVGDDVSMDSLRDEFVALLSYRVEKERTEVASRAEALFNSLSNACQQALQEMIESGELAAVDGLAQLRQRQLISRFDLVQSAVEELLHEEVSASALDEFAERYRKQVRQREGTLVPPDFDVATKVPIDDLYVESLLTAISEDDDRSAQVLSYEALRTNIDRKVVLGNPGSGKSTLAKKVVADYAQRATDSPALLPVLVVLRDYGARKAEVSCSIREFIESRISSHYQLDPPPGALEYFFGTGAAVVVFDGLDELIDTSYRQQISADIESFAALYPLVQILVTSREVGYPQAPLDPAIFDAYRLATFGDTQVEAYVTKWFSRDRDLSPAEKHQQAQSFLSESSIVPDIRSNPLMLALMCNLYKGEGYIPRNRPDVFERCAVMLFDRWDRQRQIRVPLEIESHIRPAMQHLAHWIYTDAGLEAGVPERAIVQKTTEYLVGRRYDDPADAEAEAKRFVEFCAGRAWSLPTLAPRPEVNGFITSPTAPFSSTSQRGTSFACIPTHNSSLRF